MNTEKTQIIKKIVAKIDTNKITSHPKYPQSKTLKEINRHSKRALESNDNKKVFKLGTDLAYELDILVNKTNYVEKEEEKKYWLGIAKELFENTIGYKEK